MRYTTSGEILDFWGPQSGSDSNDREEGDIEAISATSDRSKMGRYDGRKKLRASPLVVPRSKNFWNNFCVKAAVISLRRLRSSILASFHARNRIKNFCNGALVYVFYFVFLFSCCFGRELPYDLESAIQDFCVETKRIELPDYPFAFNPSIVRWNGRLLMSFRIIPNRKRSFNSELGLVFLNEDFEPITQPQLVSFRDEYSVAPCRAEDARLITFGDKLYMVYDDNIEPHVSKGGFRMFVAEIHYDGEHFIADPVELLNQFEGESRDVREKAWVPFDYQGRLLLAYSINPHRIFYPRLDGTGICDTVTQSKAFLSWNWGTLRGGTPALLEEEGYLAFFHSSIEMASAHTGGNPITHYFMGAYLFSKEPPFQLLKMSPEPIIGKNFYKGNHYKPYWKPIRCVFPCGYVRDEKYIWVSYGRQDHECWIAKIDKKGLLESLVGVTPK